jgi:hypothetical protein
MGLAFNLGKFRFSLGGKLKELFTYIGLIQLASQMMPRIIARRAGPVHSAQV